MNLLILDDEPLTIKSLKENMPWKELGIDEVYTAFEPRFAKQLITTFPIQIILCDIEMPGENGIDFLKWMKTETDCDAVTLLLTCHDEFSYAKEGISLGVMDYILKPVPFDELGDIILKACALYNKQQTQKKQLRAGQLWEQNQSALTRNFWREFFVGNPVNLDVLENGSLGFFSDTEFLLLLLQIRGTANALSRSDICLLLERQFSEFFAPAGFTFTLFSPEKDRIYVIAYDDSSTDGANEALLPETIYRKCKELIFSLQINHVNLCGCMEDFCGIDQLSKAEKTMLTFLQEIEDLSGFFRIDPEDSTAISLDQAAYDKVFQDISNYVKRHLSDEISRQDVADAVHMNVDYLSKVFKKKAGVTLSEFIRNERLNYARHLLRNSDMNINEIAMLLNFSSQSHFSSAFKKQYGCSPVDYRGSH